jgi:hypothetical protein
MSFPDADCIAAAWILLVPKTKALAVPSFTLGSWEADLTTALRISSEPSAQIDGGFLEYLSGDLLPPREPGDVLCGRPVWSDSEDPAGAFAGLPVVEGVDQVEA